MNLTHGGIRAAAAQLQRAKATIANMREQGEETVGMALQTVEVGGTAFGFAYANQRYGSGEIKILGLPADLAVGIGLHVVGLFGGVGKYGDHAHNIADGALASYAARQGAVFGAKAKQSASTGWAPAGSFTGWQPASSFDPNGQQTGWQPAESFVPRAA